MPEAGTAGAKREPTMSTPDLTGYTVLVIDDNEDALFFLTHYLQACHANVVGAHSAGEAREVLATTRPDVIISDLHMPGESGVQFLRWLRSNAPETLRTVPVIGVSASSAYTRPDDARAFTAWFGKPTDYDRLCETVAEMIRKGRALCWLVFMAALGPPR